jgi:maleate isomerase
MYLEDATPEDEGRMLDEFVLPAVRDLATAHPHVIVFGCTSAGALRGNEYDAQLTDDIADRTGVPAVSVIKSVRDALRTLDAVRLVVVTPYVDELNVRIKDSLESDARVVLCMGGLGISENFQISQVPPQQIIEFSLQTADALEPDALFVSCTNFPAMSVLSELRTLFPFPIITSNQAALEAAIAAASTQPA